MSQWRDELLVGAVFSSRSGLRYSSVFRSVSDARAT